MYEVLNSFKWKTHPKISIITHQFWKTPKPQFQNMKCMKNERLETYQEKKNFEKAWKITKEEVWSESDMVFGR